jgi:PAS domain S-box-containing protein
MKPYIRIAIVVGLTALLLVLASLLVFTVLETLSLSGRLQNSIVSMRTTSQLCSEITSKLLRQYTLTKHYLDHLDTKDKDEFLELSFDLYRKYYLLEQGSVETNELQLISSVKEEHFRFEDLAMRIFVAAEAGRTDEAGGSMRQLDSRADALGGRLAVLNEIAGKRILEDGSSLNHSLIDYSLAIGAILIFTMLATLLFFYLVRRNFLQPTSELIRGTREVAFGNLDMFIDVKVRNEMGMLAASFNDMVGRLKASQGETKQKAEALEHLNRQITALNESLEQKVEERTSALQESEAFLQQLIYKSPVSIAVFDRSGLLLDCNEAFLRLIGVQNRDGVLRTSLIGYSGKLINRDIFIAFNGAREGQVRRTEAVLHQAYGKERWYIHNFFPTTAADGKPGKIVLFSDDVTEQKLARDRIQVKNKELESFVYTVSHDLKSPLFSLAGMLRLLENRQPEASDEEGRSLTARIVSNLNKMEQMIDDLLELSRVGSRKADFRMLDLNQIVSGVLLEEKVRFGGENVETEVSRLPRIVADEAQITRLFQNLINNAFKYRHPERALQIKIGCENFNGYHLFTVEDNGMGIDESLAGRIFDVFFTTAKEGAEGSGVGLAIAKKIVEVHGGRIWVESKAGEGSRFRFTIDQRLSLTKEGE